ncbi:MAG: hypothetical protein QF596_01630 [Acidimicrobiales bacterium]|jgi:hypothetical protein|nr:hypothetical protein [Acidimicrobiales bacterium]MDP6298937.1 hypothetical protein [Acidimicrobiales bacterium]
MDEEILWPPQEKVEKPESTTPAKGNKEGKEQEHGNKKPVIAASTAPTVTLAEAVRDSSKSRGTLRRWITDGKIEGAIKTETGWQIPIPSLISSGAWDGVSAPDEPPKIEDKNRVSELEAELLRARLELNSEKKLREAAERNADDLRFAMRMLTAGNPSQTKPQEAPPIERRPVQRQRPPDDRWEFTPAAIIEAANKFRRKLLG